MEFWRYLDRVYIYVGKDFMGDIPGPSFEKLIEMVGLAVGTYQGQVLYEHNEKTHQKKVCKGRTKACIVRETNKFIAGMGEYPTTESLSSQVSKTQLSSLVKALKSRKGRIPGHTIIILHVMLYLLTSSTPTSSNAVAANITFYREEVDKYVKYLRCVIQRYFAQNRDDKVAQYFLECCVPIDCELEGKAEKLTAEHFPAIPKYFNDGYLTE